MLRRLVKRFQRKKYWLKGWWRHLLQHFLCREQESVTRWDVLLFCMPQVAWSGMETKPCTAQYRRTGQEKIRDRTGLVDRFKWLLSGFIASFFLVWNDSTAIAPRPAYFLCPLQWESVVKFQIKTVHTSMDSSQESIKLFPFSYFEKQRGYSPRDPRWDAQEVLFLY